MKKRATLFILALVLLFGSVGTVFAEGLSVKPVVPPMEWSDGASTDAEDVSIDFLNLYGNKDLYLKLGATFAVQTEVRYNTDGSLIDNSEIIWSVQYPEIASIDNQGVVTALKVGQTLIQAKCKGVMLHFEVFVEEDEQTVPDLPSDGGEDTPVNSPTEGEQDKFTIKTVSLNSTEFTYNGKKQKPTVKVVDSNNAVLKRDTHYTVTYESSSKKVGTYSVIVKYKGKYKDNKENILYYDIVPKGTTVKGLTAGKKKITVTWKKQTKQVNGYQLQCSLKKNFKSKVATVNISGKKKTNVTLTGLKAKKKYYVRIRTYKNVKVNGKTTKLYSAWSTRKKIKTK